MKLNRTSVVVVAASLVFTASIAPAIGIERADSFAFASELENSDGPTALQTIEVSGETEATVVERDDFAVMSAYEVRRANAIDYGSYLQATQQSIQLHDPSSGAVIYPLTSWGFSFDNNAYRTSTRPDHNGVDMLAPVGTPIYAIADATVKNVGGPGDSYGYYVILSHIIGGTSVDTIYAHLSEPPPVRRGQSVDKGSIIGSVGCTGRCTGAHLHFEVLINGVNHDPASWLQLNAVR